MGYGQMHIV